MFSFITAPEKSQFIIFSRRKFAVDPHILLDSHPIQYSQSVRYLGLLLDSKIRWVPHFRHLYCHFSYLSNFHRSPARTWWGNYSSVLLLIFHFIIKTKVDFGSFVFASVSLTHRKKIKCSSNVLPSPPFWSHSFHPYRHFRSGFSTYRISNYPTNQTIQIYFERKNYVYLKTQSIYFSSIFKQFYQ